MPASPRPDGNIVAAGFVAHVDPVSRCADLRLVSKGQGELLTTFRPVGNRTACRFAVGRPGECSSVFRVWANRKKFDVYAAIRTWNGLAKFSFHESGQYIYHLTSTEHENARWVSRPDPLSRRIERWEKPPAFVPGWTHLLTFMVPTYDVRPSLTAGYEDSQSVRWIAKPSESDTVTEFRVAVGNSGFPLIDAGPSDHLLDAGVVDGFVLVNGQVVVITMHVTALDPDRRETVAEMREWCAARVPADFELDPELGPRFAFPAVLDDGRRALWDLSALA
ncbi:MAG: hypothetical protein HZB45_00635 [Mycolicibacterium rufum]|nr:hypothetical protein [Mycolicibacterium rufum]